MGMMREAMAAAVGLVLVAGAVHAQPTRPQTAPKAPTAAGQPLGEAERTAVEELQAAQKQLDTDGARVLAASPDGRRRVADAIARQLGVPEKLVNELRARRMGYGEATITLALAQQLLKRERGLTLQQAIDRVLALRASHGWGVVARDLGLKLGDVVSDVKRADKQLAKLDAVRTARAEKQERTAVPGKPARPDRIERPARPEKVDRNPR